VAWLLHHRISTSKHEFEHIPLVEPPVKRIQRHLLIPLIGFCAKSAAVSRKTIASICWRSQEYFRQRRFSSRRRSKDIGVKTALK
jgi:hypothetical protein